MAERVSASIAIGGRLTADAYSHLCRLVSDECLSIQWEGDPFEPDHRTIGRSLQLYAHEVPYGRFERLEAWCVENHLPFARWSGGYPGQWGAERLVYQGQGEAAAYPADEDDYVIMGREKAQALGSFQSVMAYYDAADLTVPSLVVDGEGEGGQDG